MIMYPGKGVNRVSWPKSGACERGVETGSGPNVRGSKTTHAFAWVGRERKTGFEPATFSLARRCSTS